MFGSRTRKPLIDEEHHLDRRRRRPRPQRPAVDVDDGRQRRVAGVGWRGDPRLDVAAGPGRQHGSHLRPPEAALPARADRGPRPERAALDRHQLRRPPAERAEHRHGAATDREVDQRRVGVRSGEWRGRRRAGAPRLVDRERPRHFPAAVGHDRDHRPRDRARPGRSGSRPSSRSGRCRSSGRSAGRGPARAAGRGLAVGRADEDRRAQVVGSVRVVDADDRQPAAVRRERRAGRPAGEREELPRLRSARRRPRHRPRPRRPPRSTSPAGGPRRACGRRRTRSSARRGAT